MTHKVQLTKISVATDLKSLVVEIAGILQVKPKEVVEMLRHLPLTLAEHADVDNALLLQQRFESLNATLSITPAIVPKPIALPQESKEPVKVHVKFKPFSLVLVVLIVAISALVLWIAKDKVYGQVEKVTKTLGIELPKMQTKNKGENAKSEEYLIAANLLTQVRNTMNQEGWKNYGVNGELPYEGQDLLPDPKLDSALKILLELKRKEPKNAEVYYLLSEIYLEKGLAKDAIQYAEDALALNPNDPGYMNRLGQILLEAENEGRAELLFRKAIEAQPDYLLSYRNLGVLLLYHQKDSLQALQWLHYYLQREPGKDWDRFDLRQECVSVAFRIFNVPFEQLLPQGISFAEYEGRRKMIEADLNRGGDALAEWSMAKLALGRGMQDVAMSLLQRLFSKNELNEEGMQYLVVLYAQAKAWDSALRVLKRGAETSSSPFFSKNEGLFELYLKLDFDESYAAFKRYESLGGDQFAEKIRPIMPVKR